MITPITQNPTFALSGSLAKGLDLPATGAGVERIRVGVIGRWYGASLATDAAPVHAA